MGRAKSNRTPSKTPVSMKPKKGDLFSDQQDRQKELGLSDPKTTPQHIINSRGCRILKAWRLGKKSK